LGYQEYVELRDSIDKNISTLYAKLQKKDGPRAVKKKKKGVPGTSVEPNGVASLGSWPAASGLGPDDDNILRVPEQLTQLVATRRQWVDAVGGVFQEKQREQPGRIWALPPQSIFDGVEEEVQTLLERHEPNSSQPDYLTNGGKGKGKARLTEEEMDLG